MLGVSTYTKAHQRRVLRKTGWLRKKYPEEFAGAGSAPFLISH